ncbi:MAG: sugar MFS transporter [Calditrichia bacterium]
MATMQSNSTASLNGVSNGKSYTFELTALTTLFFMWGFLTCLNDILIPHLKAIFSLNYTLSMLVQFVFFFAYFVVSIPAGKIIHKIGYKSGIVIGLITAGIGAFLFYPAAGFRLYVLFLIALFILASGITILQVAANPYVSILGKPETASSRLNLTQAFNSLGTTIAPLFGSYFILSVAVKTSEELSRMSPEEINAYKLAEAAAVQVPYLGIAVTLILIAAVFAWLKLPNIKDEATENGTINHNYDNLHKSAWGYKHLVLGAVAIFVYVGAEVSIGSFLVNYLGQDFVAGMPESVAGKYVSFYWGGAMVGRFIGSAILRKIEPRKVLAFNAIMASLLVVISMTSSGTIAMWSILGVGLFNSIMFPTIFTLAVYGLGKHTSEGSGILCAAIVGGALIPVLQGAFADSIGIQSAFFIPVICYLYIVFYGMKGAIPEFAKN